MREPVRRAAARSFHGTADSTYDRSNRVAWRCRADSPRRSVYNTKHSSFAGPASGHSPGRTSCRASKSEAEHRIGRIVAAGRGSAEMVPAVGIVAVAFDLFRRNQNELSVLPAPRKD